MTADGHETAYPPRAFFALAGGLFAFFLLWSWLALSDGRVFELDKAVADYWYSRPVGLDGAAILFTELGSIGTCTVLGCMGALWQSSHGRRRFAATWLAVVISGALLNVMLKTNLDRPRPPEQLRHRAVLETNESYPSGHAMGGSIGYGMLGFALVRGVRDTRRRLLIVLFLGALVSGIGFSRVYLRAHWFSDVVAGFAVGLAWLFFCVGCVEWRRARLLAHEANPARPGGGDGSGGPDHPRPD